jgi:hypothetical protein
VEFEGAVGVAGESELAQQATAGFLVRPPVRRAHLLHPIRSFPLPPAETEVHVDALHRAGFTD